MGACKGCGEVVSAIEMQNGYCKKCATDMAPKEFKEKVETKEFKNSSIPFLKEDTVTVTPDIVEIDGIIYRIDDIISAEFVNITGWRWGLFFVLIFIGALFGFIGSFLMGLIGGILVFYSNHYLKLIVNGNEVLLMKNKNRQFIKKIANAINESRRNWILKQQNTSAA